MHPQEPKRPRGRPVTVAASVNITLRLSAEHRDKLKALGGAEWVRARLDEVQAPKSSGASGATPRGAV